MKLPELSPSFVRGALFVTATLAAFASGAVFGIEIGLLVAAFGALGLVIAFVWASVLSLTGDSPLTLDEALTLGQPSVEEEQKRAVLRGLKDLEYERSVGKISDQDYAELSARYREEAKRLIELVDASLTPARERAEKLLAERIGNVAKSPKGDRDQKDGTAKPPASDAPPPSSEPLPASDSPKASPDASDEEERA